MRYFSYRHVIGFEETNLVGNVYYVNHLRWQGRCREMFLRQHCPQLVSGLGNDLVLATTRCSCEYFAELAAFDEIEVRMFLAGIQQNRVTMRFEYWRLGDGSEELAARGEQQIACMQRRSEGVVPIPVPHSLRDALAPFAG